MSVECLAPLAGSGLVLAQATGSPSYLPTIIFFVAIIAVFYFFIIRPQKKREGERQKLIESLKKGDHVVTIGGIYGVVAAVQPEALILRIDEQHDVRVRVLKTAISRVEPGEAGEPG